MKDFVAFIAKHLVDHPEDVVLDIHANDDRTFEIVLKVNPSDVGKVIGKQGKTAQAIRTLLTAVSAKEGKKAVLKILD
ncbi:MAG: nucleic acid binding protein [Ignavibacteria bacterium]|nr:MAG: nucleic acid binding protein [Ignavibacteria bacterium]KAF0161194.1 MAG: nucleic acid binding protein [Ignavibacteria bacterium]